MKTILCLLVGFIVMGTGIPSAPLRAGALAQADEVTEVSHIGVVVQDIEQSARAYAAIVGIDPPPATEVTTGIGAGSAMATRLHLGNITIELIQPGPNDRGPLREFLDARGPGVHHLGLRGSGDRPPDDLTGPLGLTVEYETNRSAPAVMTQPRLGHPTCVTHIGIAVRDIDHARKALADVLGVDTPNTREFDEPRGRAQFAVFALENVSIELLQQVDAETGTYADFVSRHGPQTHHLGLHLRGTTGSLEMPEQIAWLEQHDGEMAVNGGGFAYLDLRPKLGVFIEALSTATNDLVYPHPHPSP